MKHLYEYRHMTDFIVLKSIPDFTNERARVEIAHRTGDIMTKIPKFINAFPDSENWEVNSHSISLIGNALVLSILFQRRNS